jgi:hypothetical protein
LEDVSLAVNVPDITVLDPYAVPLSLGTLEAKIEVERLIAQVSRVKNELRKREIYEQELVELEQYP